jgi:hypothetical protein
MSLKNLSLVGHLGNFVIETEGEDKTPNDSPHKISLYDNPFEFSGTNEILHASLGNSDFTDVAGSITGNLDNSHNVKMLTFGMDSIFAVGQSGGLLPNLESLGLLKYMDIGSIVSGMKLPSVLSLPGKKLGR